MNISVEKQPNCTATLRVEIPSETVQTERSSIVSTYASQARIQGFRPGKAPKKVIEKRFAEQITGELEDRLARKAFDEALQSQDLKVLNFGRPSAFTTGENGAVSFESVLTLAPEIALPDYKGVTINAPSSEVTDEELDQQLQTLRERSADYSDVEGRNAASGDILVIDYTGKLDDQAIEEVVGRPVGYISGREGFWIKLDEESFLPGFAIQLEGAAKDESRTVKVTVPEDFPVAELREKELTYEVTVKEIKEAVLPELDDEFAAKLTGDKTLEELKDILRERMGAEKQRQIDDMKVNQIVEHFNTAVDFELPDALLRQETQSQADSLVQQSAQSGLSQDEILAQRDEIFASAGVQARTNLKTNFILQEIARAENLSVSDQELVGHLAQVAASRKENPKKFIKQLQREGRIAGIRNSMLVGKAIDFVLEHASVEEIPADQPETSEA
ncbi:trigger factor [Haloferula luteola]|uniref:Trigger factor n=1 Tax=Haloferula luteola TaxID=595692 RepID=A0A840VAS2_9BACT|nr:trigger factor [Haloferula luteola]MBB5351040.1 trigger factor [Haloferula luteola]